MFTQKTEPPVYLRSVEWLMSRFVFVWFLFHYNCVVRVMKWKWPSGTGYSSDHHPPWLCGIWLTSLNWPTPRSSSEYVLSSSINSFGFSRGILKTFIESPLTFSFIRWFHSLNLQDRTRDAELREALLHNHWTSHQVLPHSMTSMLRGWLSRSFATPHMPSPHLFQVLFYVFLFAICCLTVFANLIAPCENK